MTIYEYILEDAGLGSTCPPWINDGGYFRNSDKKLIGVHNDNNAASVPDGAVSFTTAELESRQLAIHAVTPFKKEDDEMNEIELTNSEVRTRVQTWVTSKSS